MAAYLQKMTAEGNRFRKITIQTHHGDAPLEIVEWWPHNDELFIGVVADAPQKLQELTPQTTSTGAQVTPTVKQDQTDATDQMTDAEKTQIQNAQKEQEKLTNDIRRIDGGKQKLLEPMQRKIQMLDRAKAAKEKKLGTVTQKIASIQRKYSKV